jgi:thiol-disulfide isomerase/thioredoxin
VRPLVARLACGLATATCLLAACDSAPPDEAAPSRFAAVRNEARARASTAFCDTQWPAANAGGRKYRELPERPLPGARPAVAARGGSWKWVNLWATWCVPCLGEMSLLDRWKTSLEKDGIVVDLELWSVDEDGAMLVEYLAKRATPGRVRWLRSADDLPAVLESLGVDRASGIPVHALVDGDGNLRCARVGSVHDEDYGAVKTMLSGS